MRNHFFITGTDAGVGKTTLGRSILRLIEPTAGKVIFDGDIHALAHTQDEYIREYVS